MIDREFKNKLFQAAAANDISDIELFYLSSKSDSISVYKANVENYESSSKSGIGVRGLYNGVMGYYYSEIADDKDIPAIIDSIKQNAGIIDSGDEEFIFDGSESYAKVNVYNEELNDFSMDDKIAAAMELEKTALEYDPRIKSVSSAVIASGESEVCLSNSKGLDLSEKSNYLMAYVELIAEENGSTKEKGDIWIGSSPKELDVVKLAQSAADKAIGALCGSPVPSGTKNVIIQNEVFAEILGCFVSAFYADSVQKGFSLLKGKLGKKIAADIVSIADDPLLEGGMSTTAFDSEGVATYNKTVVEKGVLKTYLYNLKTAHKDGVASTGNGFKSSYKGTVNTSATNFYIGGGTNDMTQLKSRLGDGLIINDVAGLHSGANVITGDFSLAASGFLVEKGEIVRPVEQITIASNFFEILQNITELGNDLYFTSSGIGSPSVLVKDINVSGE